jgi:hypothetical protein
VWCCVWYVVCGVWCVVYGVRCVWCVAYDVCYLNGRGQFAALVFPRLFLGTQLGTPLGFPQLLRGGVWRVLCGMCLCA